MRQYYLPLFWKFSIAIIFTVLLFGILNILIAKEDVYSVIETENENKAKLLSNLFSHQAKHLLNNNEETQIQNLVTSVKESDRSIAYAIVNFHDENKIISALDSDEQLILKSIDTENAYSLSHLEYPENEKMMIIDISKRISTKPLIYIKLGLYEEKYEYQIQKLFMPFIYMISAFLLIGILSAFLFARLITKPINDIVYLADNLEISNYLNRSGYEKGNKGLFDKIIPKLSFRDELDILQIKFYKMLKRVKQAYKEKEQSYTKLIQAEKLASIGTLTAGVAHEINNPIAGIKNCTRRIKEKPENIDQNLEYIDLMIDAINKIEEVVKRLLDYSRDSGTSNELINIRELIDKSILLISYKFEKYHISINNKVAHNLAKIEGNFNQLEQVFVNIFLNSIDAIESRNKIESDFPLLVEIFAYEENEYLVIEIIDNGIGMNSSDIELIFDPFFTTKEVGKGTGLGLFVSYNIIKSHKGNIKVHSEHMNGSKFIIELKKVID